ncbi:hypothetical protein [Maliponia aquimaris]|uniref:DUF883 domain-containing protein n=1 Tax=Maliponia aquimaris TaxID=1673631 RepID=A0A238L1E9_9RHOB|nr:hypothetical protein [Maliponia aquimaris]SMX48817.1 hypothetical protein MAA8898_04119 [Maliponia aquimaris]
MATAEAQTRSTGDPEPGDYERQIRSELAEIRSDLAALTKSLAGFGKARADDAQDLAAEWSDEVLAESRRAVKKLRKQVSRLEKGMESSVREHPLQWFLGAMGIGMVLTMLIQRNRD